METTNNGTAAVALEEGWLSIQETCARLGKAPKTVESMVTYNQISSKTVPRAGRKPERVYEARDVQRLLDEADERAKRVRPRPQALALGGTPKPTMLSLAPEDRAIARDIVAQFKPPPAPPRLLPWITVAEAAAWSGLSEGYLLRRVEDKQIVGRKGGDHGSWRILRASLDEFTG